MKFKDLTEVIKNEKCQYFLDKQITATNHYRSIIPKGTILKRSPIDYLQEHGMFTAKELLNQYIGIIGKETDLPSEVRATIILMVRNAIQETIKFYENTEND